MAKKTAKSSVTVTVADESPKAVMHALIAGCLGERDGAGMDAALADWTASRGQVGETFAQYCRRQSWTLAQVLSLLEWQCKYIFGEGLDEQEFHEMWRVFGPIVREQELLDVAVARRYLERAIEVARGRSRAAYVEA